MSLISPRIAAVGVLLLVGFFSWGAREMLHFRFADPNPMESGAAWVSADADGLYHARRVARAMREGEVAGFDPLLDFPNGALIPWPSVYDQVCVFLAGVALPNDFSNSSLEQFLASLPLVWGVGTSVLIAMMGILLLGWEAGLLAGCLHAFSWGSIHTSAPGVADHHAWICFGSALVFLLLSQAIIHRSVRRGVMYSVFAGAISGVLVASWTAAILVVGIAGCVLLLLPLAGFKGGLRLGCPYLISGGLSITPFALGSPWLETSPWSIVELSWFQPILLCVSGLAFLPSQLSSGRARTKLLQSLGLGVVVLFVLALSGWGPGEGMKEAFSWVSRSDSFMSRVAESEPLLPLQSNREGGFISWLGITGLLFVCFAPRSFLRGIRVAPEQLPWIVFAFFGLILALTQRRFSDLAVLGMSVVVGVHLAPMLMKPRNAVRAILCVVIAGLLQIPTFAKWSERGIDLTPLEDDRVAGEREMARWLKGRAQGVLSTWDLGHLLEWEAEVGTVVTNFGTYLGPSGWADAGNFFLADDAAKAEEILKKRNVDFVLRPSRMLHSLEALVSSNYSESANPFYSRQSAGELQLSPAWYSTPAHLLGDWGDPDGPEGERPPFRFLRLVYVSSLGDHDPRVAIGGQSPIPVGHIWERVEGVWLEARGLPGEELRVDLEISFWEGAKPFYRLRYGDSAKVGESGVARLRLPWATDRNGEARVDRARWRLGEVSGDLIVPEEAVRKGATLPLG